MRTVPVRSLVEGGAVVVIGASILLLVPSQTNPIAGLQTRMSPGLIPSAVAIGLIITGFAIVLQAIFRGTREAPIAMDRTIAIRMVTSVLLLVAYAMLFPRLGFVVTSGIFIAIFSCFIGARDPVKIALLVIITPIVVWLFFEKLFGIPLPHGLLF